MKLLKELERDSRNKILGLLLFILALLLLISSISFYFSQDHNGIRSGIKAGNYSGLMEEPANRGGIIGGFVAAIFDILFGICSIFIPFGLAIWGINRFFGHSINILARRTLIAVFFLFTLMILISLFSARSEFAALGLTFGGAVGHYLASWLVTLVGTLIAFTLTLSLLITALIFVVPGLFSKWGRRIIAATSRFWAATKGKLTSKRKTGARVSTENRFPNSPPPMLSGASQKVDMQSFTGSAPEARAAQDRTQLEASSGSGSNRIPSGVAMSPSGKTRDTKVIIGKGSYRLPTVELLVEPPHNGPVVDESYFRKTAEALRHTLLTFGVEIEGGEVNILPGPIITRFEFKPASGIKVSQIVNLSDDLALAMQAERIRIVAPIPGKPAVGIEIPNKIKRDIYVREIISSPAFMQNDGRLLIALGKTISGEPYVADLARMPHLLIAGATGSGKSVCLNCLLTSLIFRLHPDELRFILIDPKRLELSVYDGLPHLEKPVVTEMKDAEKMLSDAVIEMEDRYRRLARAGVRNIIEYNQREQDLLPYLVIVVDELADIMMSGLSRVEALITRLAQMARAVGIHLILATQRPSVDVITGLIKANFSTRVAFQTASKVDSRTILDCNGAEKLLGRGDMLFSSPGFAEPLRIHGAFISGDETERLVEFICQQEFRTKPIETFEKAEEDSIPGFDPASDPLFREAVELVIRHKQGSVSLLQRRLGVGYQRAARLIDQLEQYGVVGPYDGSKAREVLVDESFLESKEYKKP
jgi:S-DNA-T family DNA segregation ATPase FtsK/SpoIIIE